jgi:hypothetical protein
VVSAASAGDRGPLAGEEWNVGMRRALALLTIVCLGISLSFGAVAAKKDSAPTEETTTPTTEDPTTTTTAPSVPIGANLTPPVGLTPPVIQHPTGTGQPGSSSVSMAPGTLTSGVAHEDNGAVHQAPPEPAPEQAPETVPAVSACTDYPTWYDAQLALESSVDPAQMAALDPDGNTIACEEEMYPDS